MANIMEQNKFTWPLINDNITQHDKEVLADFILKSNRFTNGPKVKEFEKAWSDWLGVKYSVMVNSGASANYISIAIAKHLRGQGSVAVPPLGWVSDVASVVNLGMDVVWVDAKKSNFSLDEEWLEKTVWTEDFKAIVLVHGLGFNGISDKIIETAKKYNLILIEDCCESHGATYKGKKIGTFGDMSLFSFYYGHHMTTIEGGMICTNNEEIYELARMYRSHGMTREASKATQEKYASQFLNPLFTFAVPGFNMRSTELNAVLGLEQLPRLDYNIKRRQENFKVWLDNLDSKLYFTEYDVEGNSNFALPLIVNNHDRELLKKACNVLDEEKVEYRLGTIGGGSQAQQPYMEKFVKRGTNRWPTHTSNYIHSYGLYIGNHTELTAEQIVNLCKRLNNV